MLEDYHETFPPVVDLNDDSDSESGYEPDFEDEMHDVELQEAEDVSDDEDGIYCRPAEPFMAAA